MGMYKSGRPSVLTLLAGKLAMQQAHAFFVRRLFFRYY